MIDRQEANRLLAADAEFQRLRASFNTLGILRFLTYVATVIFVVVAGINQAVVALCVGIAVSAALVLMLNYNRTVALGHQRRRAVQMGLLTEADVH